jgi:phospho-N-acetylmuramoyl-pentapeptide-transferase
VFLYLIYPLKSYFFGFNVFRYITVRAAFAALTAILISFVVGPWVIRKLKERQIEEAIRGDGPPTHFKKSGTPSMGGLVILTSIIVPILLFGDLANGFILLAVLTTVWLGVLGFSDDYLKIVKKEPKGLIARTKFIGQLALGVVVGVLLVLFPADAAKVTQTTIPFFKDYYLDFLSVPLYIAFVTLVITGSSNAVNLTDGLDGLAIGLVAICGMAFAGLSYLTGHAAFSQYLNIDYLSGAGELTVYCAALVGASLGFLWFNSHPARVFMGDTGSLPLGGLLGLVAVLIKKELLLVIVGGVFVAEVLSVMLQVVYYKIKGKRIFRMAPLHHHFELLGWSETSVVVRFWIVGIICALLTLSTLKLR